MSQAPDGIASLSDRLRNVEPDDSFAPKSVNISNAKQAINEANLNLTKLDLSGILLTLSTQLRQQYQERLDHIILFGSHARGQATSDSDIDVLIILQEPVNSTTELQQTSQLTAQLCFDHNVLISRMFMSRSRYETEQSPLLKNIRRELKNIRREGILL
jgi:uncharacterized protein